MNEHVIGFKIESVSERGKKAIRKNAKIPFLLKSIWSCETLCENPLIIRIKLKDKSFKRSAKDSVKRLVINGASNLVEAIKNEMQKSECFEIIDYMLEVITE